MNEQTKQQIIALGRLGWSLRRIQKATGQLEDKFRGLADGVLPAGQTREIIVGDPANGGFIQTVIGYGFISPMGLAASI